MSAEDKIKPSTNLPNQPDQAREVSRREMLTGAGVVAAGVVTAVSATSAFSAAEDQSGQIGVDKPGVNAGEFRSWVFQSGPGGETFVSLGFLTRLSGVSGEHLFAGQPTDLTTALFTFYAEGTLQQRVFGENVHTLDVMGTLVIYQRGAPGASLGDPGSFRVGTPVAQFALTLQDVLTVFAPGRGLPTLTGDMRQTDVGRVSGIHKGGGVNFGRMGMRARLLATGLAQRPNSATFDTQSEMSGNWTVEP